MTLSRSLSDAFRQVNPFIRQASKKQLALQKLEVPLRLRGKKEDVLRMTDMINEIAEKSPMGKAILEEASKNGTTVRIINGTYGVNGSYEAASKTICLSRDSTFDRQLTTLVHESRHAGQRAKQTADMQLGTYSVRTNLMHMQLAEADAVACSLGVAHEMKQNGDARAWNAACLNYRPIANVFAQEAKKGGLSEALQSASLGWFASSLKPMYERQMIDHLSRIFDLGMDIAQPAKELSNADMSSWICLMDGKNYMKDVLPVLNTPKYSGVSIENKEWLDDYAAACRRRFNGRCDKTIAAIPEYKLPLAMEAYVNVTHPLPLRKTDLMNAGMLIHRVHMASRTR